MLYVCAVRFNLMENFEKLLDFGGEVNKTIIIYM